MSEQQVLASQQAGENLMAVRTQRMCVDPRAKTAHSCLLESNRTRGHSEIVRTGNNQGRSTTGNVFNRLGR